MCPHTQLLPVLIFQPEISLGCNTRKLALLNSQGSLTFANSKTTFFFKLRKFLSHQKCMDRIILCVLILLGTEVVTVFSRICEEFLCHHVLFMPVSQSQPIRTVLLDSYQRSFPGLRSFTFLYIIFYLSISVCTSFFFKFLMLVMFYSFFVLLV